MFELMLIRHGQTDWNVSEKVMGRQPIPLNNAGKAQVRDTAKGLKDVKLHALYASPTMRTMQTAQLILRGRDSIPFVQEEAFSEMDYGEWIDKTFTELYESGQFQEYLFRPETYTVPAGSNVVDYMKKAVAKVEELRLRHPGERIAIVSHSDVIKLIVAGLIGLPINNWQKMRIDNASMTVMSYKDDNWGWRVMASNVVSDWERYLKI